MLGSFGSVAKAPGSQGMVRVGVCPSKHRTYEKPKGTSTCDEPEMTMAGGEEAVAAVDAVASGLDDPELDEAAHTAAANK